MIVHLGLWVIIPTLVSPNPPLDVIEGYVWGHEWLIGTYKHPPMQAWWLESLDILTGHAKYAPFLASQLAILLAFWAVWQTGLRITDKRTALLGVLLLEGVVYYNLTSPEFNPNVMQLPFWALISLYYYRSIKENKILDWLLLGACCAGGLYSKYSTVLLLISLTVLTLTRPEGRRKLLHPGPYIALIVALLLFLPHLLWLFDNQFLPFNYARERLNSPPHTPLIKSLIVIPLMFIGSQVLALLPAVLLFIGLLGHKKKFAETSYSKFDYTFMSTITFGPCLLVLILVFFAGIQIRDMWATPFWNFIGLWALLYVRPVLNGYALYRFAYSGFAILTLLLVMFVAQTYFYPAITNKALRIQFPGQQLADNITTFWNERYHRPLIYVIGDSWPAGNIAYFAHDRAHVLIEGNYTFSPWIKAEDLKRQGGIMVWCIHGCASDNHKDETPPYVHEFPNADIQPPLNLSKNTPFSVKPATIGWAILPPQ